MVFSNLTNVAGANIDFTATWKQTEFPITVDKIPEHVSVMVVVGDEQIRKEETGWYVPANTNATVIFTAHDNYLLDVNPVSTYATFEVAVGETAPATVKCPKVLTPAPSLRCVITWWSAKVGENQADLTISVKSGTASAITDIAFLFEDRADGSRIAAYNRSELPEWGKTDSWFTEGVTNTWRMLKLDSRTVGYIAGGDFYTKEAITFYLKDMDPTWDSDTKKKFRDSYICWIGWKAYGRWTFAPVGGAASEIAAYMPEFLAPVSVGDINAILDYTAGMATLEFTHFKLVDGKIAGVVRVSDGEGAEVSLSGSISATLHGTDDLTKAFEPCGNISLKDGAFTMPIPTGKSFFKLSLESPKVR